MSYKPLSQTVTDGQKNPISSDAVHDHVDSAISAIPESANPTLSNLTAPTAVNQDLNLSSNKLTFGTNNRKGLIVGALPTTATGITVTVPNAGDVGFIIIDGNPTLLNYFKVNDIVSLSGLATKVRVTSISASGNNVIVFTSPNIGAGGGGTPREVLLERPLISFDTGNTINFGISRASEITTSGSYFAWVNSSKLSPPASGIFIGPDGGNGSGSVYVGISGGLTGPNNFCFGGLATTVTGQQNTTMARGAKITSGSYNTVIGDVAQSVNTLTGNENTLIGCGAGYNTTTGTYNVILGSSGFDTGGQGITTGSRNTLLGSYTQAGNINAGIALGFGSRTESNAFAVGSLNYPIKNIFLGSGAAEHTAGTSLASVTIQTAKVSGTDISALNAELYIAGSQSTGAGVAGGVILQTASSSSSGSTLNPLKDRLRIEADGKIGLNIYPQADVHVKGEFKTQGNLLVTHAGKGLQIAEGDNATMGVVTLVAGEATVPTTAVKSNSRIILTAQVPGGTPGFLYVDDRTANTEFDIKSSSATDTSDVAWMIVNPVVYDSDAETFFTAAGSLSSVEKMAVSELVVEMKAANLWTKVKAVYPFVGGTSTTCKFNLKDPQDTDGAYRMVFSGSPTFTNGFKAAANTTATTKFPHSDFAGSQDLHAIYYSLDSGIKDNYEVGSYAGNSSIGKIVLGSKTSSFAAGQLRVLVNDTFVETTVNADGGGLVAYSSTNSNQFILHKFEKTKFIQRSFAAISSYSLSASEVLVGQVLSQSGGDTARRIGFLSLGDGLTGEELLTYAKLIETFVSTLGRQV